jgi:hypothetical protein
MTVRYLTNELRTDGFGAQFQSLLSTILYTEISGKEFVYTNIERMDHITPTANFIPKQYQNTLQDILDYMAIQINYPSSEDIKDYRIVKVGDIISYSNRNINLLFKSLSFATYLDKFYSGKSSRFDSSYTNVAIHIRRPDDFDIRNNLFDSFRRCDNSHYINILNSIRHSEHKKPLRFHIYSCDTLENLKDLASDDVVFHIDEKVLDTFNDLVFADILVLSKSSFSYIAALLSRAEIKYYTQFWHPPLDGWIICNDI